MKTKTPSLGDIAKQVQVSKMAVSLALRGSPEISEQTREKILAAAREMGYSACPQMSRVMAEVARVRNGVMHETLAFVTTEPTEDGWKKYDSAKFEAMQAYAAERGYNLEPWWLANPDMTPERVNAILWSRGITGIVIPNISRDFFEKHHGSLPIEWEKFCVLEMGGGLRYPNVHQVLHDHYHGMFLALADPRTLGQRQDHRTNPQASPPRRHRKRAAGRLEFLPLRAQRHRENPYRRLSVPLSARASPAPSTGGPTSGRPYACRTCFPPAYQKNRRDACSTFNQGSKNHSFSLSLRSLWIITCALIIFASFAFFVVKEF